MGLPSFSIKRPVLTAMLYVGIAILGIISLMRLQIELYQGTNQSIVSIVVRARGGLPSKEVEKMITRPIEEAVATVSRLKNLYSNSREAESRVTMEFETGTNMDFASLEIREKFARVKPLLPDEIEKPVIANYDDAKAAILVFAVTSDTMTPEETRDLVDNTMKPALSRVNGVASVEVYGGRERKILVELDRDKMVAYNVSIERIMDILGQSNVNLLAGSYETGSFELGVRTMGSFVTVDEIGELGIKASRQGSIIPLKEIATIKDSYMEASNHARLNLEQNVTVYVKKTSLSNTLSVSKAAHRVLDEFEREYEEAVDVVVVNDRAETIGRAIGEVKSSLYLGLVFTVGVIALFMGKRLLAAVTFIASLAAILIVMSTELGLNTVFPFVAVLVLIMIIYSRAILPAIILISIPCSLVTTFIFMAFFGISINIMTLSGLALSMGILVDSSVVVMENIFSKKERGYSDLRAIREGSEEVWLPLLASMTTTLVVFLPIMFIDKKIQLVYGGLAFTVTFSLLASFFAALMLLPMLMRQFARGRITLPSMTEKPNDKSARLWNWIVSQYKRMIHGLLHARFIVRLLFCGIVLAVGLLAVWGLGKKSIDWPTTFEENEFAIVAFPLAGAMLESNDEAMKKLEEMLGKIPDVEMFSSTVAKDDLRIFVRLKPKQKRRFSKEEIIKLVDEKGNEMVKEVHDDYSLIVDEGASSSEQKKLVLEIFGHNGDELERLAKEFAGKMNEIPGVTNLVMTDLRKRPEYALIVDRLRAAYYGIRVKDVADSLHAQVRGMRPTKFHELESGKEIETITRLQPIYRKKMEDLKIIHVANEDDLQIPLQEFGHFVPTTGPQTIDRKDKYRYVFVKGDVKRPIETVAREATELFKDIKLPDEYYWRFGGGYEELIGSKSQLTIALILTLFLVYMTMACLFQSYSLPLLIMVTVPMALIGVWLALDWPFYLKKGLMFGGMAKETLDNFLPERKPLSQQVFIGMILLAGYVVNAAIILADHAAHLMGRGYAAKNAFEEAGLDRLRPILMTTCSTVLGFMPLALALGQSSDLWSPLAVTVIGGLITSTFLTLFVLPVLMLLAEDLKNYVSRFMPEKFKQEKGVGLRITAPGS